MRVFVYMSSPPNPFTLRVPLTLRYLWTTVLGTTFNRQTETHFDTMFITFYVSYSKVTNNSRITQNSKVTYNLKITHTLEVTHNSKVTHNLKITHNWKVTHNHCYQKWQDNRRKRILIADLFFWKSKVSFRSLFEKKRGLIWVSFSKL